MHDSPLTVFDFLEYVSGGSIVGYIIIHFTFRQHMLKSVSKNYDVNCQKDQYDKHSGTKDPASY